ncbi:hypothetical protein ABIA24_006767 [Sinorhizobium fredii]|uniref:hypothetical protein n=1 Tax=Rhizobium fredii TaxID=380 RepID=UPI003514B15A
MLPHPTFIFSSANVAALKKALRNEYPDIGSSHADEALAASFGFKTHAAMLHILRQVGDAARMIVGVDHHQLAVRLLELGYLDVSVARLWTFIWKVEFPVRQYDDTSERAIRMRLMPNAANSP